MKGTPTPPVGVVYHNKVFVPVAVAVRKGGLPPWQYLGFAGTTGAVGSGVTTTVVCFTHALGPVPIVTV